MSAVTAPVTRPHTPVRHTFGWLTRVHLYSARWVVGIVALVTVIAIRTVDHYTSVDISIVQYARQAFIWFPFSMAIGTTSAFVGVHVAAGLTRRALGIGAVLHAVVMGLAYTVVMIVALQIERAFYGTQGWGQAFLGESSVFVDTSQIGWILADLALVFVAAHLSGLLVGVVYYRVGGWWGTLALPLTLAPLLVVVPILAVELLDPLSTGPRVLIAIGVLAVAAAAYMAIVDRVPIRQVTT